ncbi:MAG: ABC transporter permease [Eubacteriales bacterium]|nr:ABC transporter permease [Eubacteriales bacterium]
MRVRSAWRKNRIREVLQTLGRYLAILSIVALGVGLFAGLRVTRRAMVDTADAYLRQNVMFDDKLVSTLGWTEDDVNAIAGTEGISKAEGSVTLDVIAEMENGSSYVLAAHSITNDLNRLSLTAGRLPQRADECVADADMLDESSLGTKIHISGENDADTKDAFAWDNYTIVGLANSTEYLNIERGTTKLAGGKISAFLYLPKDGFSTDYFTEVYVSLAGAGQRIFSDEYQNTVDAMEQPLKDRMQLLANARYEDLRNDANGKIADGEQEYNDGLDEYNTKKADADRELGEAEEKLANAKEQIEAGWGRIYEYEDSLDAAEQQYQSGLAAYPKAYSEYTATRTNTEAQLAASQSGIDSQMASLSSALLAAQGAGDTVLEAQIQAQITALNTAQAQLNAQKSTALAQLDAAEAQLNATKAQLDAAPAQIAAGRQQIEEGKHKLYVAQDQYDKGMQEYLDAKTEAQEKLDDAKQKLDDAKKKIDDAKADLAELEPPDVYVLDREMNTGYNCFENDSAIVAGISKVFPVFFFLIAALVCMTTMTRMVEEQRTQIGTLKALGYGNAAIAWKYLFYAASATGIGCVLGFFGGIKLFPWVIWQAYGMLYGFAPILYVVDWSLFAALLALTLLGLSGVTYLTCRTELKRMPAELMRPKTPKEGKRVFLERIPFLWRRLRFLKKISLRNVLRYTKRLVMMVLGIGGCTALLMTGFGIRDSIANIAGDQFDNIMVYDFAIVFDEAKSIAEQQTFQSDTDKLLSQSVFICTDTLHTDTREGRKQVNVIATGDPAIMQMISLHTVSGDALPYPPDGSVVISEKLAKLTGVSAGDTIHVTLDDAREADLPVSGVFENFVYHYILMTPATYEALYRQSCAYDTAFADSAQADKHVAAAALLDDYGAANVSVTSDIRERVEHMMSSLDLVIFVVIISAGALAFVVLFNLSNINITERIREIATIKVLGFYAPEVGAYVFRENLVLTMLGSLAGIPLGIWLHAFVMSQLNFDMVNFHAVIKPVSYLLSVALTFVFAFCVDLIMRPKLERINMVESLKAIE